MGSMLTGMGRGVSAAVLAVFLTVVPARAQDQVFEVGAYVLPPFSFVGEDDELHGNAVTLLRTVLKRMGYTPSFRLMPLKRCLAHMRTGDIPMMLPVLDIDDRYTYMRFSAPVAHFRSVLWKRGSDLSGCWQGFDDLKGLRIGTSLGYAYSPEWQQAVAGGAFRVETVAGKNPNRNQFLMLREGRIDMFICDLEIGRYLKARNVPLFNDIYPCPRSVGNPVALRAPVSLRYFEEHGLSPDEFLARFDAILERLRVR